MRQTILIVEVFLSLRYLAAIESAREAVPNQNRLHFGRRVDSLIRMAILSRLNLSRSRPRVDHEVVTIFQTVKPGGLTATDKGRASGRSAPSRQLESQYATASTALH